jgi:hypothetical protein
MQALISLALFVRKTVFVLSKQFVSLGAVSLRDVNGFSVLRDPLERVRDGSADDGVALSFAIPNVPR